MKRRRFYISGIILSALAVLVVLVLTNLFAVLNTLRDARLYAAGYRSDVFRTDSSQIAYSLGGSGDNTVLFVHGFGVGGATTWFDAMLSLDDSVKALVPDLLWFGESDSRLQPSLHNQAAEMWKLCDHLHIRPQAIVGISYGGFVAMEMLNQRPGGASQLLIVNSPGPAFGPDDIRQMCDRAGVKSPEDLFIPHKAEDLKKLMGFVMSNDSLPIPDFVYRQMFESETQKHAAKKRALMRELVDHADLYRRGMLSPATQNAVIWSRNDRVFPLSYGKRLADTLHAEISVLEHSGHVPHPSDKEEYIQAMRRFLIR